jgi:hypothetical protein
MRRGLLFTIEMIKERWWGSRRLEIEKGTKNRKKKYETVRYFV